MTVAQVNEVSEMFGIKANQINPVRNYNSQTECVLEMDILTLRALRQILRYSQTYLKDMLEREEEKDKQLDQKVAKREKKNSNNGVFVCKVYLPTFFFRSKEIPGET